MLTLLWGLATEEPLARVASALEDLDAPVFMLDQRRVLDTEFKLLGCDGLSGYLKLGSTRVELEEITACYLRPYDSRHLPTIESCGPDSEAAQHAASVEDGLLAWLELTPAVVVNRPSAMLPNGSKPYQLDLIWQAGFSIPQTLVTTDPEEVKLFLESCSGQIIYKSISGVRSRITRFTPAHRERIAHVVNCPTQFQQYIEGHDYRAHVVGNRVFSCRIHSEADDYRYGGHNGAMPMIYADRLPRSVEDRLLNMTKEMGLVVAGVDLRRTAKDEWYCFEVNPSPAFTFYEQNTGQAIAAAIAQLLTSPSCPVWA